MTDKKKADQQASPKKNTHLDDTSGSAQRLRLLERLQQGAIDTITARRELNILMPAARIKELKDLGHNIGRELITITDDQGRAHRGIALYYLGTGKATRVAA